MNKKKVVRWMWWTLFCIWLLICGGTLCAFGFVTVGAVLSWFQR